MPPRLTERARSAAIWAALLVALGVPLAGVALSPLLAWRDPVYIAASFSGVIAMGLLVVQPLLVAGYLPGLRAGLGRRAHQSIGAALVAAVVLHIAGLWITSPPDVIDALVFASPTPFSVWGVLAMWAVFATAGLALMRQRLRAQLRIWRMAHTALAVVIVAGTVVHVLLIQGTLQTVSKVGLCLLACVVLIKVIADRWRWKTRAR